MIEDLPDPVPYVAICHTEGCMNNGKEIEILGDADSPFVTCGPCEQPVSDITAL